MTDLRLDPDDGRDVPLRLPRRDVACYVEPSAAPNPYADLLNDVAGRVYADYCRKMVARAEELAGYGLGLGEVDFEVVTDPDDPAKVTVRGMWKIVRLNDNEETP